MTKEQYLWRLERLLSTLPAADREEILGDLREHFDAAGREGETEQDIIAKLGTPESVAVQYGCTDAVPSMGGNFPGGPKVVTTESGLSAGRVMGSVGMGFLNFCIVYPVLFSLLAAVYSLVAAGFSVAIAGGAYLVTAIASSWAPWMADALFPYFPLATNLFVGLAGLALGILLAIWTVRLAVWSTKTLIRYVVWSFRWTFCLKDCAKAERGFES